MKKTDANENNKHVDLNAYFIFGAIVLVFLLGMYAIFSPGVQTQGNPACGKIVIAADGSTLRANVSPTLQDALYFLVVDPLSSKLVEVVRNPYKGPQPSAQIAYLVAGKGEEAVIVGNIDQQSYNILMQFGIRTFGGYTGQAKKVISLYRQARISAQSPTPETLPAQGQVGMQPQPTPVAWGAQQPTYPGPVYPNAFQGQGMGVGPNCPIPGQQAWGRVALPAGAPDGDTIRSMNPVFQVALAQQQAAMAQQAALAQQPPADVATNPLWERAALAQQAAVMAQQAALAQQPPANVANNPLWERAAATVSPQPQGNITWELAAAQQQQAAMAQQAALAQQAAMAQPLQGQYAPVAGAQGYFPPSQYPASQYPQVNAMSPIAAQVPITTAPPIMSNAQMPHAYRGNCTECHQVIDAGTTQNTQQAATNQMMWENNLAQNQNSLRVGLGTGAVR